MKRLFDLLLATTCIILLLIPIFFLSIIIFLTSKGPIIHWSDRIGKNDKIFRMPKFRSMHIGTPALATHLIKNPSSYLTPIGSFLRKTSLDELPQIWCIFKGDMSFVGPRPALYNQYDLIELRNKKGVYILTPGLTGWAQINGRDDISISQKVAYDVEYLYRRSMKFDILILFLTFIKILKKTGISH